MIAIRGTCDCGWIRALVSTALFAFLGPAARAGDDDAAGPAWLRAPLTRGPVAATLGLDTDHAWWGIDGAMPLALGHPRVRTNVEGRSVLGLGLSIAGQGGSEPQGLRYAALVDRRSLRTGEWLGVSTGGGSKGQNTRLQLGTGIWRSLLQVEMEAGVVSSFVGYEDREASHWGFYRDSLHWRDTTTYQSVDRSGLWHTAQSALRWHYGRMELTAVGGVTVGEHIEPRRWAQAIMHLQASRRLLVMAAFGQRPAASMAFDPSAHPQTMIGVQLAPWASRESAPPASAVPRARSWLAESMSDGLTKITVRCSGVFSVELAGDFTDWAPVALTARGGDRWETTVTILPGLHQVRIRLDGGEWQVPPGLPSTQRDFAGAAGVLLIE